MVQRLCPAPRQIIATARDLAVRLAELARAIRDKARKVLEIETERGPLEPSALGLLRISRGRDGGLELAGRAWREDGSLSARYASEAAKERKEPAGIFYYWRGERPRDPNAPQLEGTGEIRLESDDRAAGYWTTRADAQPPVHARTSGVYVRADPEDLRTLDGPDDQKRAELLAERLRSWRSIASA